MTSRPAVVATAVVFLSALTADPARADAAGNSPEGRASPADQPPTGSPAGPALAPPAEPPGSYIGQVVIANIVGFTATTILGSSGNQLYSFKARLGWYALLPYLTASPAVHLGHGKPARAAISLLSRGLPILAAWGGLKLDNAICPPDADSCVPLFMLLGFSTGLAAAGAIDALLAKEPAVASPPPLPLASPGAVRASLAPIFFIGRAGTITAGVAAIF